jgi:endoglucanase
MRSFNSLLSRRLAACLPALAMWGCLQAAQAASPAPPTGSCARVTTQTCALAKAMGRGINMAGMLESPEEGDWGTRLDPAYVDLVAGKFNTVRIPVRWSNHASPDAAATLDDTFLKRVTSAVDAFLGKGMHVVIDVHHYQQLFGEPLQNKEFAVDDSVVEARLVNIWRQLGKHFKDRPNRLVFELLNEPAGKVRAAEWNALMPKLLAAVRESNPDRAVMIEAVEWAHPKALPTLKVPDDRNLMVAVHTYDPFNFTHQGVNYLPMKLPVGVTCCDDKQKAQITGPLQAASAWSTQNGYPLYLGEFGVMKAADVASRATYARTVRTEAERLGISWAYWDFANAFGIYSPKTREFIEPMLSALLD